MDLKLPITIHDELSESIIKATGLLDLASGEIRSVEYETTTRKHAACRPKTKTTNSRRAH